MATHFTDEIGDQVLELIHQKNWKVCYEFRHEGDKDKFQTFEEVYHQVAERLEIGPRCHVFPAPLNFDAFIQGLTLDALQIPKVTIQGESRVLFGFGLREDHCFLVTNSTPHAPSADREPKDYEYMLDALETLEEFVWPPKKA